MADCLCGHDKPDHRNTISGGRVFPHCTRCDACNGFGIIDGTVLPKSTLLYAWNTRWCPTCGSRYFAEDAECCGAPCLPVRLEMHSREPG